MDSAEVVKLIETWILATTALLYCYSIASRIPKGTLRLISILPVVYLFLILPLRLTCFYFILVTVWLTVSLGIPRLLLFSFDAGPLSPIPPNPLLFFALTFLPVKLKQLKNVKTTSNSPHNYITSFFSILTYKLLLLALWLYMSVNYRERVHPFICSFLYAGVLYFFLEIGHAVLSFPAQAILGVEIEILSNHPYRSTSLQDFWGHRWNLVINNILRLTTYKPIKSISTPVIGSKCASLAAMLATFAVSGLMHEALYFYFTRVKPTGEVTMFFVLHGVCVAIEDSVKSMVRKRWRLHPAISCSFTMTFVAATSHWLFLPQLRRNGVDDKILGDVQSATIFARKIMKNFISRS